MFSQLFFILIGCFLIFTGIDHNETINLVLGIICVVVASERLYHLKSGKAKFGFGK
jgi:type IV secretory pathway VirB2 component (pilin)